MQPPPHDRLSRGVLSDPAPSDAVSAAFRVRPASLVPSTTRGRPATGRWHAEGLLFDTACLEPEIHLWVREDSGTLLHLNTTFHPRCHLTGPRPVVESAARRLAEDGIAESLGWTRRIEFWSGEPVPVLACRVLRPGRLVDRVRTLLHKERRLTAYDVDLDPTLSEAYFQLGRTRYQAGRRADAVSAWKHGAAAGGLDPWATRCAEAARRVESGQAPVFDPSSPAA